MAEIPDYLIYHDEKINSFIDQEINVTIQVMTTENSSSVNHTSISPVIYVVNLVRCPSILICMWLSFFIVSVY